MFGIKRQQTANKNGDISMLTNLGPNGQVDAVKSPMYAQIIEQVRARQKGDAIDQLGVTQIVNTT